MLNFSFVSTKHLQLYNCLKKLLTLNISILFFWKFEFIDKKLKVSFWVFKAFFWIISQVNCLYIAIIIFFQCELTGRQCGTRLLNEAYWNSSQLWKNAIVKCQHKLDHTINIDKIDYKFLSNSKSQGWYVGYPSTLLHL